MKLNRSKLCVFIAILLLLTFTFTLQAREIDNEKWFGIIRSYFDAMSKPDTEVYGNWEVGVKEEFGLTMEGLKFNYKLLEVDQDDKIVMVTFLFGMTAFCYDKNGDKNRVEMVRMVIAAIDKKTEKIIDTAVLSQVGPTVIHGWNGGDV